jgi:hypothetical protein
VTELSICVPETERRLSFIDADSKELPFKLRLQIPEIGGSCPADAESRLPHAGKRAAVLAELILERRKTGHAHRVEPVRVDRLEVLAEIEHHEPVDFQARLGRWRRLRLAPGGFIRTRWRIVRKGDRRAAQHEAQCHRQHARVPMDRS